MTEKRWLYFALGVTTIISLGAVTNQLVPVAPAGVALTDAGITFPDGTEQTTAATNEPDAWPMICEDDSIAVDTTDNLSCSSVLSVPGGSFGFGDPVPSGYYFLVTDFHLEANTSTQTGYLQVRLEASGYSDVTFKLPDDVPTQTSSFRSPILIVPAGSYLSVRNTSSSDHTAEVRVTGYLTSNPERFGTG